MAALYAVDRVYQVAVQVGALNFHSAHVLFNGLYLAGILTGFWPLALAMGLLKLALYLFRKDHFRRLGRGTRRPLSLLRLVFGFGIPALIFGSPWGVAAAVLGDLVDRCEYYEELDVPSPARAIHEQMEALTS